MNFMGGFTLRQVMNTTKRLVSQDIIPIIDYAKEGSRNLAEVSSYCENIKELSLMMSMDPSLDASKTSLALKLSSFLPSENAPSHMTQLIVDHVIKTHCKTIMFDAEEPCLKSHEDLTYKKINHNLTSTLGSEKSPVIFKTFQAYRRDSMTDMMKFIDNYYDKPKVGIKLVRGAYWKKDDNTFYQDKDLTDENYNRCLSKIIKSNTSIHLCVATHNKESVELAKSLLHNSYNTQEVYFAQLLGMTDDMSQDLKNKGYKVMKYVPYGTPLEMLPYLYRRLLENVSILKHVL
jgi:proline dehydrogenase